MIIRVHVIAVARMYLVNIFVMIAWKVCARLKKWWLHRWGQDTGEHTIHFIFPARFQWLLSHGVFPYEHEKRYCVWSQFFVLDDSVDNHNQIMNPSDYIVAFSGQNKSYCVGLIDMVDSTNIAATIGNEKMLNWTQAFIPCMWDSKEMILKKSNYSECMPKFTC